ncbi:MAG: hypothetical protein F6J89_02030 [Symploca sp. SIO1C4]|uniref:Trypsin-co-occurring domain-containing protein n=1 Tax=Symploca sp. SIO1C4 TaxID=2607765 RepID=A0A6B3MZY8_9CYAN|nr:hypothetical protein [Symploca sp. SIO1C4]
MTQLTPVKLEDGTIIYLEAKEDAQIAPEEVSGTETEKEVTRADLGKESKGLKEFLTGSQNTVPSHLSPQQQMELRFQAIEGTIRAYTKYTLNAFKKIADANVKKVTLEFGIKVGGKAGIPYVTEGTAESNLKITVECTLPENED